MIIISTFGLVWCKAVQSLFIATSVNKQAKTMKNNLKCKWRLIAFMRVPFSTDRLKITLIMKNFFLTRETTRFDPKFLQTIMQNSYYYTTLAKDSRIEILDHWSCSIFDCRWKKSLLENIRSPEYDGGANQRLITPETFCFLGCPLLCSCRNLNWPALIFEYFELYI